MQRAERIQTGGRAHVIDRNARDQLRSAIARTPIGINDHSSLAGKSLQNATLNRLDDRTDRLGVIVSGQAHKDIYFADIDQLAKKIVRKKGLIFQFQLYVNYPRTSWGQTCEATAFPSSTFTLDSPQPEPEKLVGPHR